MFDVSVATIYRAIEAGQLRTLKLGAGSVSPSPMRAPCCQSTFAAPSMAVQTQTRCSSPGAGPRVVHSESCPVDPLVRAHRDDGNYEPPVTSSQDIDPVSQS